MPESLSRMPEPLCRWSTPSAARLRITLFALLVVMMGSRSGMGGDELGVQVPPGFEVTLFADDDLAHDVFCLTTDSLGRVAVSGRGYVRILIDADNDGVAESAQQYADGPRTGAQGMYFHGRDLICSGDAGLIRYRDQDGDDRADGPAEIIMPTQAGGEHDIHAVRRGPDGWWYVIAGNMTGINAQAVTRPHSPVTNPQAGTLLRFTPDLTDCEVVGHGFRNAYDFDFHTQGDLYAFDSDGERDISLPWYRPTRVFHVLPGTHAGWLSRSWKRPDAALDMPPVVAEFGRGSPTGVVCYRHTQFPEEYRGALFVLDWTYGRVMVLPLTRDGSIWKCEPKDFMTGVGQFGFAPTDAAVGADGSLYVSVGGRGTRGGVYRIRWTRPEAASAPLNELAKCLRAPQPLSSWSRHRWEPLAEQLGQIAFEEAAISAGRSESERVRAIEILTEKFGEIEAPIAEQLSLSPSVFVRARAAWSMGGTQADAPDAVLMDRFLRDSDPLVVRAALESLMRFPASAFTPYKEPIAQLSASADPVVRETTARLLARADESTFHDIAEVAVRLGWEAGITIAWAFAMRNDGFVPYSVEIGRRALERELPMDLKRDAARLVQIALGDVGPKPGVDPVFDGYGGLIDLSSKSAELAPLHKTLSGIYPTGDKEFDDELGRLIAMTRPDDAALFEKVLAQITPDSHPVDDIHQLIISALLPIERTADQRAQIAGAFVSLESKITRRGLNRDANWQDRVMEMYIAHAERDPELISAILNHPDLGAPGHVALAFLAEDDQLEAVIGRFVERIQADNNYPWSNDVIFLLGESQRPEVRELLRSKADDFALRPSVLTALTYEPDPRDRPLFIEGLDTHDLGVLSKLMAALATFEPNDGAAEQVALVRTLRRMGPTNEERKIQDAVVQLLKRNTGKEFGYQPNQPPSDRQTAAISEWSRWAESAYPEEWARQTGSTADDIAALKERLENVDWSSGDASRGHELFHKRSCAQCHGGRSALGPDLTGVAGRFSRLDLFTAIALPNRDVSPRYQATVIVTTSGQVHTGLVIYESVDGLVLRTSTNQTLRFKTDEIDDQRKLNTSLMPTGLLKDLEARDLADLYAYLQTLGAKTVAAGQDELP